VKRAMTDTDPKAEAVQIEILRKMSPARKIAVMDALCVWAAESSMRALRRRHPDDDEKDIRRRYAEIVLGEGLAERVYGPKGNHD